MSERDGNDEKTPSRREVVLAALLWPRLSLRPSCVLIWRPWSRPHGPAPGVLARRPAAGAILRRPGPSQSASRSGASSDSRPRSGSVPYSSHIRPGSQPASSRYPVLGVTGSTDRCLVDRTLESTPVRSRRPTAEIDPGIFAAAAGARPARFNRRGGAGPLMIADARSSGRCPQFCWSCCWR